jgi:hypothetical protein
MCSSSARMMRIEGKRLFFRYVIEYCAGGASVVAGRAAQKAPLWNTLSVGAMI